MGRRPGRFAGLGLAVVMCGGSIGSMAPVALAGDEPVYHLPAPAGTVLSVTQGPGDPGFRTGAEAEAYDFAAAAGPARFPVVAARGGIVIGARSGVRGGRCQEPEGGPRPACWRDVNYVLIDHGDGTSGLYLHLRPERLPVRTGEVVSTGQPLGSAGDSGWTDDVGLQFQVQRTPSWLERGRGGWFLTASQPVAFSDPDVRARRPDGALLAGDTVTSGSPVPIRAPFRFTRRPTDLPATVPFQADAERHLRSAYEADSPDGYGLSFAPLVEAPLPTSTNDLPSPAPVLDDSATPGPTSNDTIAIPLTDDGTMVRPLFGGELVYAGCASGASATLGRMVVIRRALADGEYVAVLGHLSEIEPTLLDVDPEAAPLVIGPNELLGRYGVILPPGTSPALACPEAGPADRAVPASSDLFATILRDATVTPEGEIVGGTPVSPEPLVGALAYEGFDWWTGPVTATTIAEEAGRPRARWSAGTPADASRVVFGDPITLAARVRDVADIAAVRFRAYYPAWPRPSATTRLPSFQPTTAWRQLALCTPPERVGQPAGGGCRWRGTRDDAVVTWAWDPSLVMAAPTAPWLPRARAAMTLESTACVPVSLAVEVVDRAGQVFSEIGRLPLPAACDEPNVARSRSGRVLYLDPLVPPTPPLPRGEVTDRGWPPVYAPDPLDGAIVWRDRSPNEDGFRVYARRSWFEVDCSVTNGPWQLVTQLPADTTRYRPQHSRVVRSIDVPRIEGVPGAMTRWEYAVSAFNEAGETAKVRVGGFVGGSEAFCDPGLEPPPDL